MSSDNYLEFALDQIPNQYAGEIIDIFKFISHHPRVIFKSQQIDDPDLSITEKYMLVENCFHSNRRTFLLRYGSFLEEEHLHAFAQHAICEGSAPELGAHENVEEIQLILKELHKKLQKKQQTLKNRRYAAMQKMIKEGHDHFSEQEMMCRAPELYQELVGQYLTEADKAERDSYDVRNTTMSGILMHQMEQQKMQQILEEADEQNQKSSSEISEKSSQNTQNIEKPAEEDEVEIESFGKQWGNFDDEQIPCSSKKRKVVTETEKQIANSLRKNKPRNVLITPAERKLFHQEFVSIMQEEFLNGKDEFDYSLIDDDSNLDDLNQINQDEEDAYFAESDDNGDEEADIIGRDY